MTDILVLMVCAVAALIGWRRGTLPTLLPLVGLVAGYAAAIALHRPLAAPLVDRGVPPLPAYVAAGLAALLATVLFFRGLAWWLERRRAGPSDFELALGGEEDELERSRPARGTRSAADRAGGAALNALWAFGVAMVVVWAAEGVMAATGSEIETSSFTGRTAGRVVGGVAERITAARLGDDFTAATAGALFRDPGGFARMLDELVAKEDFRRLVSDPEIPRLLAEGRVAELARRPELGRLLADPDFRDALRRIGVVEEARALSPEELADALSASLGPVAAAVTSLRQDPDLGRAIERLDLPGRLRDGDLVGLFRDADFTALMARVAEGLRGRAR